MKETTMLGIFAVAGVTVLNYWKINNQYWLECDDYEKIRKENPWWLVKTKAGLIEFGWRKRVISIDWTDTGINHIIPDNDTTRNSHMCHAWGEEKAIEYLKSLAYKLEA